MIPIRAIEPERFAALRAFFEEAGFTAEGVCARTECEEIYSFVTLDEGRKQSAEVKDTRDTLVRLFMDSCSLEPSLVADHLPGEVISALEDSGFLEVDPADSALVRGSVLLYPVEGLWVASDARWLRLPGVPSTHVNEPPDDVVYPAITWSGRTYQHLLSRRPAERVLELCSGTGIAALMAARRGGHAWAVDITARSTAFAQVNAALNGLENVTALEGDLYGPVRGMEFDLIAVHPPYVPSPDNRVVYSDGGEDGESITRRVVGELSGQLAPGGRLYCTCVLSDRKGKPVEARVREFLGPDEGAYDVAWVCGPRMEPLENLVSRLDRGNLTIEGAAMLHRLFREREVEALVGGTLVIERVADARPAFTLRRRVGDEFHRDWLEWALRWEAAASDPGLVARVFESPARLPDWVRLHMVNRLHRGGWQGEEARIVTPLPFPFSWDAAPEALQFLAACDGSRTVRELLGALQAEGVLPPDVPPEQFATLVTQLVGSGVLEVPEFPHPARPESSVGWLRPGAKG